MTAETIAFLTIWILCSLIFVGAGIHSGKSEKPVGINTSEKPPKPEALTDVKAYNCAHQKCGLHLQAFLRFSESCVFSVRPFGQKTVICS